MTVRLNGRNIAMDMVVGMVIVTEENMDVAMGITGTGNQVKEKSNNSRY